MSGCDSAADFVYVGAERVGKAVLERLFEDGHNVAGVVTADESQKASIADWASFDGLMADRQIPYHKVSDSNSDEFIDIVTELDPSAVIVVSWSYIIPTPVLESCPNGVVGLHYSLLPNRRGGAPLNWALIVDLDETGVSLFYMEEELDAGDVIAQRAFDIEPDDTVKDLLDKICVIAPQLVSSYADDIARGTAPCTPQDESAATYTEARSPADSAIDWAQSKQDLYNFIRALAPPYPSAFSAVDTHRLVIPSASFDGDTLEIEGYFEAATDSAGGGTLVNTTADVSERETLASDICGKADSAPVRIDFSNRSIRLTDATVDDDQLHVTGVVE